MPAGQKRAPDLKTDGCESPSGSWELNSGSLEEQAVFLTSEPSLLPPSWALLSLPFLWVSVKAHQVQGIKPNVTACSSCR